MPRSLEDLKFWKANEFRQFLLYSGIVALKDFVNKEIYEHFLTLHTATRLIACPKTYNLNVGIAEQLFTNFVENFSKLYGEGKLSYNIHNLLHMTALGNLVQ